MNVFLSIRPSGIKLIVVLGPPADGVRTDTDGRRGAVNEKMFLVLLEFDDRGIVSRFDLEERKVWFDKQTSKSVAKVF